MKVWLNPGPYELGPEYGTVEDWREMSNDVAEALLAEDAISLFEDIARVAPAVAPTTHPLRALIAKVEG